MDPNDHQRLKALLILLVVLVAAFWVGRRIYQTPVTAPGGATNLSSGVEPDGLVVVPLQAEVPVRRAIHDETTGRNPFQYVQSPSNPSALPERMLERSEPRVPTEGTLGDAAPASPPPVAANRFTYGGYATVGRAREPMGLLFDGDVSFTVSVDEVLMGRYRIGALTEAFVEIEDLDMGRVQRLSRGPE